MNKLNETLKKIMQNTEVITEETLKTLVLKLGEISTKHPEENELGETTHWTEDTILRIEFSTWIPTVMIESFRAGIKSLRIEMEEKENLKLPVVSLLENRGLYPLGKYVIKLKGKILKRGMIGTDGDNTPKIIKQLKEIILENKSEF